MSEVDRLFDAYKAEHRAGGAADPLEYLDRVEGVDRGELAALIDAYLTRAPRRAWDPAAYAASGAETTVDRLERAMEGSSGLWPALLPQLRERAQLRRSEVVERVAAMLGVADRREKVARYYHEMEQGRLSSSGVSRRVLAALAEVLGESVEALRGAGEALAPGQAGISEASAFARLAAPASEALDAVPPDVSPASANEDPWDDVDELFRGGRGEV
jgi:hypothetical protein